MPPFNGSGTYGLPGAALSDGQTVSAAEHNTLRNDLATALTLCVTRDGQSPATANLPMGGFKLTGLAAGSGNGESVRYEQLTKESIVGLTTASSPQFTAVNIGHASDTTITRVSAGIIAVEGNTLLTTATGAALAGSATQDFAAKILTLDNLLKMKTGANIASAATLNLSTATGNLVHITGTTATSAVTMTAGQWMRCIADGAWPLTYHATTNRISGGADYTCAAGDTIDYFYDGTTVIGNITKKDGTAVAGGSAASETVSGIVELATVAEVLAGTDAVRAVTAAGIAGSKSLAASGYYKFPGGLILQWATGTASTGGNANTFPTAFATACYAVVGNNTNQTNPPTFQVSGMTTTQFTATTSSGSPSIIYVAIGY